jgi:hypothetical protein
MIRLLVYEEEAMLHRLSFGPHQGITLEAIIVKQRN